MTPVVTNPSADGINFVVVDSDTHVSIFNGSTMVEVPEVVFKGTLAKITSELVSLNTELSTTQSRITILTAIQTAVQSYTPPV